MSAIFKGPLLSASILGLISGGAGEPPAAAPVNYIAPVIFGTPDIDNTLVCNPGSWGGYPAPSVSREWLRDGVPTGQTGLEYKLVLADANKTITVKETATNASGTVTKTSDGVVINPDGSIPAISVTYDTSIGNGVDENGFADLPLLAGAKRFFVNPAIGADTNTSAQAQDPTTPLATFTKAISYLTSGKGDQILIAEGSSFAAGFTVWGTSGNSPKYPVVIQSYDPADPTNEAKYGRATGNRRPVLNTGGTVAQPFIQGSASPKYIAFRGLEFNPGQKELAEFKMVAPSSGTPDYLLFENMIWRYTALTCDMSPMAARATPRKLIVRNSSFANQFGDHSQGIYISNFDGTTIEDCVFYACGRLAGVSRDAPQNIGGTSIFNHPIYMQSNTLNTIVRRSVFIDTSTDGGNLKGGGIYQGNLIVRCANAFALGSGNGYSADAPFGSYIDASYNAAIGSNIVTSAAGAVGWGASTVNGKQGCSAVHHNVLARNDQSTGYALIANSPADITFNVALPCYVDFTNNVSYLWNPTGQTKTISGSQTYTTYGNNVWDDPASGSNTNVSTYSPPNPYTEAELLGLLGYANETAFINDVVNYPEKHVQREAVRLMLAGYGVAVPAPQPLKTNMSLTVGIPSTGMFVNTLDGSTLSSANLPSGVTLDSSGRCWRYDGSGAVSSGTCDIREDNGTNSRTTTISWAKVARPVLSGLTITPTSSTAATVNLSTNVGSGKIYWMASSYPYIDTDWMHIRGNVDQSNNNSPADKLGLKSGFIDVVAAGAQSFSIAGLPSGGTPNLYIAQVDQNHPSLTMAGIINLTGKALLSNPTATATGLSTGTIGVNTDVAPDTLYWVVTTSATKPTDVQIKAGQNASGAAATASGSKAISATGPQSVNVTGLPTNTAVYAHFTTSNSNVVSSAAFTPSLPGADTLVDNFDDNSMDATKWSIGQMNDPALDTVGVTVVETGGQVRITGPGNAAPHLSGYKSVNQYKLGGSSFFLRIPNIDSYGGNDSLSLVYGPDANNCYIFGVTNTNVRIDKRVAGTKNILASLTKPAGMTWFRIRATSTTIYMDGALDTAHNPPLEEEWTALTSGALDAAVPSNAGYINFCAGSWRSGAVTTFQFDGFNTAAN